MMKDIHRGRRAFTFWMAGALAARALPAMAQPLPRPPMADMHSHYTMFLKSAVFIDMRKDMEETGATLIAWAIVDDARWTTRRPQGIFQVRTPAPGELWNYFRTSVSRYDAKLRGWKIPKALTPADVDAALAGRPHVVMASESANFLEGRPERVALAHAMGLRHLQIVHYIETPLGDLQTVMPKQNGMPKVALEVIEECKRLGVLVDLAHCTPEFVDAALAQSDATMIWSHSWISPDGGSWRDYAYVARSLSPPQAKKIAAHGGVVGLWTVRARSDPRYPIYSIGSYADEIMRMVDLLGPQAVGFGTDIEGAGPDPVLSNYGELREVVNRLARRGLSDATLYDICCGNYARVLKKAMGG
jgi:membrane dipeptidase